MNKTHWNTIVLDGTIPQQEIRQMIDHSYEQIVLGMKKSERQKLLPATQQEDEQKREPSATRARARTRKPK
jgi:hypothetical protein